MQELVIERRIRWAAVLIGAGLLLQLLTLLRVHPLAFVAFLAVGCPLIGAGVGLYLWSLVAPRIDASGALHDTSSPQHLRNLGSAWAPPGKTNS
jgi:hypothetical protein